MKQSIFIILHVVLTLQLVGQEDHKYLIEVNTTEILTLPKISKNKPAAGKRVVVTVPEYNKTNVRHILYLPETWEKGWRKKNKRYPIIFEYTGNYFSKAGSTGEVEDAGLGFALSGGKYIWVTLPYISEDGKDNQLTWWGDEKATIAYAKKYVPEIIEKYGGDTNAVFLCGFSRGAIGVNYLGLHDDEVAKLWSAFITHDHFDGVKEWSGTDWGRPLSTYRIEAAKRLNRVEGRPYLVIQNGKEYGTKDLVSSTLRTVDNFKYLQISTKEIFDTIPNKIAIHEHTDRWPLVPSKYRSEAWEWMNETNLNHQ